MEKKKTTTSLISEYGKLPPQAPELEEIVLAALLVESQAIEKIELDPIDFYKISHQRIYTAILNLRDRHNPIDMFTVKDELERIGELETVGGAYAITLLSMKVTSAVNLEYHASIIKQKSIARKLIALSSEVQNMAFSPDTDVADVLEFMEQNFTDISTGSTHTDASDISCSLNETLEYMQKLQHEAENGRPAAIPTGLSELDKELNGGWKAPDLIVLGGRPSMGKTQFAVHFSKFATQNNYPTLFISIEMTKIQLIIRMITENEAIDFYKIKTGQLSREEWQEVDRMVTEISKLDLFIADDYKIRYLSNIKTLARKMARQGKLKLMIIDYLGLIKTNAKFGTRDLEIGYITGELKNLCKELNIPIILLAQLNRSEKGAKVREPQLNDLRESGNIEQDADIVIFPHRPSYYDNEAMDSEGQSWQNRGFLVIGKHREGNLNVKVKFRTDKSFKKITDDTCFVKQLFTESINENKQTDFYSQPNLRNNADETPF
jgi:replicative DNA helicase